MGKNFEATTVPQSCRGMRCGMRMKTNQVLTMHLKQLRW